MALKIGIVGLPNVGKSTLFNALTKQAAESANFPFTTIEPNVGIVTVPDERLEVLAKISKSAKITPTTIEFVDIAGLVAGAHQGEGLGNKFLSHIREVDAIAHVVRFFSDTNVTHVDGQPDPIRDVETIETELALADLTTIERLINNNDDDVKRGDKDAIVRAAALDKLEKKLAAGGQARDLVLDPKEVETLGPLPLLTLKPTLYVANLDENQIKDSATIIDLLRQRLATNSASVSSILALSVKIEQEIVELPNEEQATFLAEYGLKETGLNRLIKAGYKLLGLVTFLTTGPTETRAWTITRGSTAPEAAGKIHSDLQRGFIRAETVAYEDLVKASTDGPAYAQARAAGKVRDEGKSYIMQDGDVVLFKFSV